MIGTREAQPIGQLWPNLFRPITIRISPPMLFGGVSASDPLALRRVTDQIMFELRRLSGQEYVDTYCKRGEEALCEADATPILAGAPMDAVPA